MSALSLSACIGSSTSCGRGGEPAASPAGESRPSPSPAAPVPSSLITTPCVLHAASAKGHRDASGHAIGSCTYGAECIAMPGTAASGDGFVDLKCENVSCSCEWSSATDARVLRSSFVAQTACVETDVARRIFMDHCMIGLRLYQDDAGAAPP